MSAPLTAIAHTPKAIIDAQANRCWNVYWRPASAPGAPLLPAQRVMGARREGGAVKVWLLTSAKWVTLGERDQVYQA